ncbi:hypothetical protein PO909_007224 [Leuciscus waleckii]
MSHPPPTCLHRIPWDEGMEEEEGGGLMNNFSLDEHQDDSVGVSFLCSGAKHKQERPAHSENLIRLY